MTEPGLAGSTSPREQLRSRGFVVYPGLYGAPFLAAAGAELDRVHAELGRPPLARDGKTDIAGGRGNLSGTGLMLTSLLGHCPALVDGYLRPELLELIHAELDEPRLETTAAMLSSAERNPMLTWHNHIGGLDEDLYRPVDYETLSPERVRRVTILIYLDGVGHEAGPLLVLPRALADPIDNPYQDEANYEPEWDGRVVVEGPPGTAVVVEERTWHASLAREGPGLRRFVGAMVAAGWAPAPVHVDASVATLGPRVLG